MSIGSTDGLGLSRLSSTSCRRLGRAYHIGSGSLAENVDELLPALQGSLPSRSRGVEHIGYVNNARPRITLHAVSTDERNRQPDG